MNVRILYEDNHLLVAVKPPMIPSQQDSSGDLDMLSMMKEYIKRKYHKPGEAFLGLVHRLDRPTGGIMVFARTSKAAARLAKQMQTGQFRKSYLAVVTGEIPQRGSYVDYLIKDAGANLVRVGERDEPNAKRAELSFERLEVKGDRSLVRIALKTGRSHQIRVQFSSRGTPLYGDVKYGRGEGKALALFAYEVGLNHPTRGEQLTFCAKPAEDAFAEYAFVKRLQDSAKAD